MGSLSHLGIALCLIFGCILVAIVAAQVYCLRWWKRRTPHGLPQKSPIPNPNKQDAELGFPLKPNFADEGIEAELMRTHNLCGPPRLLFTIKEESKEDLDSEGARSRSRTLSEVMFSSSTPNFLTPMASPTVRTPRGSVDLRLNPLFEEEMERLRSSPPPKMRFLKEAEEKYLLKRMLVMEEGSGGDVKSGCGSFVGFINKGQAQVLPLSSSPDLQDLKFK